MIQLVEATFHNFRLLRDVRLEFAASADSPVTVIRAENGTGKTTLLTALTWALFGDDALPSRRTLYRLHPLDWNSEALGTRCDVRVEITFRTTDEGTGETTTYNLVRSAADIVSGDGRHQPVAISHDLALMKQTSKGNQVVENPNAFLSNRVLPKSLKDVFFIDGDRALAFIEASDERSAKRERVEAAIRQLLGLDLLESATRHIDGARLAIAKALKEEAKGTSLADLAKQEESLTNRVSELRNQRSELDKQRAATDGRHMRAKETLRGVLASGAGDRQILSKNLQSAESDLSSGRKHSEELVKRLRKDLNDPSLAYTLAESAVRKAASHLRVLEDEKVIPNTLPDIVADQLKRGHCICGADVSMGTHGHKVLSDLLSDAEKLGDNHEVLMHLNNAAGRRVIEADNRPNLWAEMVHESQVALAQSNAQIESAEKRIAEAREKIKKIPEKDVATAEKLVVDEEREVYRLGKEIGNADGQLKVWGDQLSEISSIRAEAEKKEKKYLNRIAEETAAKDLLGVVQGTIDTLEGETLREVSTTMNQVFMNMIVEDTDSSGLIRGAELTSDHDIVVHGPGNQLLDPDRDLSGAQRRALTLAFILSLVSVSGVKAPNVVDTPLGMTSGPVRRAILRYSAANSTQLVLFLTKSEISGVEDILDSFTGRTYTLTNTDHYPERVKNQPPSNRLETLVCECDYRNWCKVCEQTEVA